jgi:phosphoribosylformylglycinamidine cyclo-ligase
MSKATYKDAGVNLDEYEKAMQRLPRLMHRTHTPRVKKLDGGFAGLFQLDFPSKLFARAYEDPVLVACTDGVGTKLKIATAAGRHDTVGIDLVAMCVNDAICCGAETLFFLDYVAMSEDDPELLESIVTGISEGCLQSGSALLGGETAIMPDLYAVGEYDLAGFSVGVVEKSKTIDGSDIQVGDVVLGLASNGIHSNGYSLVRKIVFEIAGLSCETLVEELGETVGEVLLRPTLIYVSVMREILQRFKAKHDIRGIAHITGGGLRENLSRILPSGKGARLERRAWDRPPVFSWLQRLGQVDDHEMERVFNCGIGLALVVKPEVASAVQAVISDAGLTSWQLGSITTDPTVEWFQGTG